MLGRIPRLGRYLKKGMGLMALTGRRQAEIFFSAKFSLPRKKLPYHAVIFDGQLKTRNAPGTSFEPYPIPVLADPKKIIRALDGLRSLKSFPSADAVNTTIGPQLPKYVSHSFGSLGQPWEILSKVVYRGLAHPCWYHRQGARQSTRQNRPVHHPERSRDDLFRFSRRSSHLYR
jgi:hypothetical protein